MYNFIFTAILFILSVYSVHSSNNDLNFIKNSNDFSLKLLNVLPQNQNHFYSPISITYAMYMLLNGAGGQTEAKLKTLLNIGENDTLQSINSDIIPILNLLRDKNSNEVVVRFANRALVSNLYNLTQTYQDSIRNEFNSSVDSVDFSNNAPNITSDINDWIKEQTNEKIPKLFESLRPDAVLVLANALYLSAQWEHKFNDRPTIEEKFYGLKGETNVQMMRTNHRYRYSYCEDLEASLIELPFADSSNLSMIILLPNETSSINNLVSNLTTSKLNTSLGVLLNSPKSTAMLHLPKFELKTDYDLKTHLSDLGLGSLFSNEANLSGIVGTTNLQVSEAVHKAVIKVKENGIEAAAATGIVTNKVAIRPQIHVTIDRPFLFLIQDVQSCLTLFMGQVCDIP